MMRIARMYKFIPPALDAILEHGSRHLWRVDRTLTHLQLLYSFHYAGKILVAPSFIGALHRTLKHALHSLSSPSSDIMVNKIRCVHRHQDTVWSWRRFTACRMILGQNTSRHPDWEIPSCTLVKPAGFSHS